LIHVGIAKKILITIKLYFLLLVMNCMHIGIYLISSQHSVKPRVSSGRGELRDLGKQEELGGFIHGGCG
jgi:hypothetical protein